MWRVVEKKGNETIYIRQIKTHPLHSVNYNQQQIKVAKS